MVKILAATAVVVTTSFAAFRFGIQVGAAHVRQQNESSTDQTDNES